MTSLILRTATRVLMPLLLLYGLFLFLRGHNSPGGGFAGGLVVAAAYALHSFAFGVTAARRALLVDPSRLIGAGTVAFFGKRTAAVSELGKPVSKVSMAEPWPGNRYAGRYSISVSSWS